MNVKIKAAGVACLLGDNYDRVYSALKKQIRQGSDSLFTERTPGNDYLQWELPGDGWQSLKDCDPLSQSEVKKELLRRQNAVRSLFGSNDELAQKILTVPDDSYVYFRNDANGLLDIKLTAWGYQYPERVNSGAGIGVFTPKVEPEHVSIVLEYDGGPVPNHTFRINGLQRTTGADGKYEVGDLPEGYQFDIEVDGETKHVTVSKGMGAITFDLTKYTSVEVVVTKDGQPYSGVTATLDYGKVHQLLTTDMSGKAVTKLVLNTNGDVCSVAVEGETQKDELTEQPKRFCFSFTTPTPVVEKVVVTPDPPKQEETPGHPEIGGEKPGDEKPGDEVPPVVVEEEKPKKETSFWTYLLELLLLLLLIALTAWTFFIGGNMLFA